MIQWFARFLALPIRLRLDLEDRGVVLLTEITKAIDASIKEDPEAFEELSGRASNGGVRFWPRAI
jgi:hypothetical protein